MDEGNYDIREETFTCGNCGDRITLEYETCDEEAVCLYDSLTAEYEWVVRRHGIFCPQCKDTPAPRVFPADYDLFPD